MVSEKAWGWAVKGTFFLWKVAGWKNVILLYTFSEYVLESHVYAGNSPRSRDKTQTVGRDHISNALQLLLSCTASSPHGLNNRSECRVMDTIGSGSCLHRDVDSTIYT